MPASSPTEKWSTAFAHLRGHDCAVDRRWGYRLWRPANVRQAVQGYENAGASAIQIEDQEYPKRCGHTRNRKVISTEDMVRKIELACETRQSDAFLIVARTDARTEHGLDEALSRAEAYRSAGADVLFVESLSPSMRCA